MDYKKKVVGAVPQRNTSDIVASGKILKGYWINKVLRKVGYASNLVTRLDRDGIQPVQTFGPNREDGGQVEHRGIRNHNHEGLPEDEK